MDSRQVKIAHEDWDKYYWEDVEEARGKLRMEKVLKYIPVDGFHLDVGTGNGDGTFVISKKKKTIGIDYGFKSLKNAVRKNKNLIQGDGCNLPFKSNSFSSITCLDVLEHIPDAHGVISEMHRVLAPGGKLILQTPSREIQRIKEIAAAIDPFIKIPRTAKRTAKKILTFIKKFKTSKKRHANNEIKNTPKTYTQPYDKEIPLQQILEMLTKYFTIQVNTKINYWHPSPFTRMFSYSNLFVCEKNK